ncbi:MAG: glycosyltransferase [Lentisphaerae bacterium]|nr:glycosyltransferase [Lentisphaerota bacterium]
MNRRTRINAYCSEWHKMRSGAFHKILVAPLRPYAEVDLVSWDGSSVLPEMRRNEPAVFCSNVPPRELLSAGSKNLIWIPMWDGVRQRPNSWWRGFPSSLRIVAFSRGIAERCEHAGFEYIRLQYFNNPDELAPADFSSGRVLFYWNRRGLLSKRFLRKFCDVVNVDEVILHDVPDPGYEDARLGAAHILPRSRKLTYCDGFLPAGDYRAIRDRANLFIAPRLYEGVGVALLEALARGAAVFGPDEATMNEYIVNGENGYLFDSHDMYVPFATRVRRKAGLLLGHGAMDVPDVLGMNQDWNAISTLDLVSLGNNARDSHAAGYVRWKASVPEYAEFVLSW